MSSTSEQPVSQTRQRLKRIGAALLAAACLGAGLSACKSPGRTELSAAALAEEAIFIAEYNLASMEHMAGQIESRTWPESERRRMADWAVEIRDYVKEMRAELDQLKKEGGGL